MRELQVRHDPEAALALWSCLQSDYPWARLETARPPETGPEARIYPVFRRYVTAHDYLLTLQEAGPRHGWLVVHAEALEAGHPSFRAAAEAYLDAYNARALGEVYAVEVVRDGEAPEAFWLEVPVYAPTESEVLARARAALEGRAPAPPPLPVWTARGHRLLPGPRLTDPMLLLEPAALEALEALEPGATRTLEALRTQPYAPYSLEDPAGLYPHLRRGARVLEGPLPGLHPEPARLEVLAGGARLYLLGGTAHYVLERSAPQAGPGLPDAPVPRGTRALEADRCWGGAGPVEIEARLALRLYRAWREGAWGFREADPDAWGWVEGPGAAYQPLGAVVEPEGVRVLLEQAELELEAAPSYAEVWVEAKALQAYVAEAALRSLQKT